MNGSVIRTITIMGKAEGLDKLTADINKLAAAEKDVAVVSEQSAKGMLTLEQSMAKLERRFVDGVRAQQDYEKIQKELNRAVAQNPALQERAAAVLAAVNEKYNQGTVAQKAFAAATSGVQGQLLALSAGAGPVGVFLSSLGPWGLAAATGLGAVSAVFNRIVEGAERIGDKSIELRKFSDVTGLTVQQIKGLTQAGGRLGVNSEEIETSLEKFSVGLNEAREHTGSLYDQVRKINPELANQLALAPNAAKAWDILAQAIRGATDASQRNALARAAFGRGGIETGLVAVESATKGGIDNLAKASGLTKEWVDETARLRAENVQLEKSIKNTMDAAYALPVLQRQNEYLKVQKQITDEMLKTGKTPTPVGMGAGLPELVTRGPGDSASFNEAIAAAGKAARAGEEAAKAFKLDPETTAGWQQLDDAMGAAVLQSGQVVTSLQQQQAAAAAAANDEKARVGYLGAAATEQERLNAKTLELNALLINNKISQEDYNRALGAAQFAAEATLRGLQDQGALISANSNEEKARLQAANAYRDIVATTGDTQKAAAVSGQMLANSLAQQAKAQETAMIALQGQLSVAQQLTGIGQINAQYEATIANLKQQGLSTSQALAQADAQREIALAGVNAQADRQLKTLEQQGALIGKTGPEKDRIKAEQTYQNLIDQGVSKTKAAEVANQQLSNAIREREIAEREAAERAIASITSVADAYRFYREGVISWSVAFDEAVVIQNRMRDAANAAAVAISKEARAASDLAIELGKFVPFSTKDVGEVDNRLMTGGAGSWKTPQGYITQFDPKGYTLEKPSVITTDMLDKLYGAGNYSIITPAGLPQLRVDPEKWLAYQKQQQEKVATDQQSKLATSATGIIGQGLTTQGVVPTIQGILAGSIGPVMGQVAQQYLTSLQDLVPQDQKASLLQQELNVIKQQPVTLEREQLIQQLTDALKNLQTSVDANTNAITDVFSPFYSSDPRRSKLGFRTFAGGGIMTALGELPLRQYQGGGMATSPQVAVFGEGSTPEAYVPVPNGRIPVEVKMPANSNRPVQVTINVMGNANSATAAALKQTGYQAAQVMRRSMAAAR